MKLYPRLLLWLGLNLLLLVALFLALPGRAGLGWELLLTDSARERLLDQGERLARALSAAPESQWPGVLDAAREGQALRYTARAGFGPPAAGRGRPPPDFGGSASRPPGPPPEGFAGSPPPPPPGFGGGQGGAPARAVMMEMIELDRGRWFGDYRLRIPARRWQGGADAGPLDIQIEIADLRTLLRLLGVGDWALFALLAVLGSALLWWPFIVGITRAVVAVTRTTERIADGHFEARVPVDRGDELGQLAAAVNRMAQRLDNQLQAQKQFVADVAHEVTSPLARLRVGLDLLQPQLPPTAAAAHADLEDDARQMAALLDELLLFSRAGLTAAATPAEALDLGMLVREALEREDAAGQVVCNLPETAGIAGHRALLVRAIANLVRNALRYGRPPVELRLEREGAEWSLRMLDRGPGVPEASLARLGEPFYRPDAARDRDSGGTGLGLAIVRRCVESAGGRVRFGNREGGGFEAVLWLPIA